MIIWLDKNRQYEWPYWSPQKFKLQNDRLENKYYALYYSSEGIQIYQVNSIHDHTKALKFQIWTINFHI